MGAEACGTRRAGPAATNRRIVANKATIVARSAALATRKVDGVIFANTRCTIAQRRRGVKAGNGPAQRLYAGSRCVVRESYAPAAADAFAGAAPVFEELLPALF